MTVQQLGYIKMCEVFVMQLSWPYTLTILYAGLSLGPGA